MYHCVPTYLCDHVYGVHTKNRFIYMNHYVFVFDAGHIIESYIRIMYTNHIYELYTRIMHITKMNRLVLWGGFG